MTRTLRIATRASALAQAQTALVAAALHARIPALTLETLPLRTEGDLRLEEPLHTIGGKGLFTREIDEALLDGRADLAVHSLKDLPTSLHPDLCIAAIPPRESDADVLVLAPTGNGKALSRPDCPLPELAMGAVVATGSLRRGAQIVRMRPDVRLAPVRGNIDTRLRKLQEQGWAGLVLAEAGLRRLGRGDVARVVLADMLPAAGQGALACMIRADDARLRSMLESLHDEASALRVWAERAFLSALGAGCHAPVGVRTRFLPDGWLHLQGGIFSPDGTDAILARAVAEVGRGAGTGATTHADVCVDPDTTGRPGTDGADGVSPGLDMDGGDGIRAAEALGRAVARTLLERGAGRLLAGGDADA